MEHTPRPGCLQKLSRARLDELETHFLALGPEARVRRFWGVASEAHVRRYCESLRTAPCLVVVWRVDGVVRGSGELIARSGFATGHVEIALSVQEPWQRRGVGTALLKRLLLLARNRGVRQARLYAQRDNRRIRALATRHGARFSGSDGGTLAVFDLPPADPASVLEEATFDALVLWQRWMGIPLTTPTDAGPRASTSADSTRARRRSPRAARSPHGDART